MSVGLPPGGPNSSGAKRQQVTPILSSGPLLEISACSSLFQIPRFKFVTCSSDTAKTFGCIHFSNASSQNQVKFLIVDATTSPRLDLRVIYACWAHMVAPRSTMTPRLRLFSILRTSSWTIDLTHLQVAILLGAIRELDTTLCD